MPKPRAVAHHAGGPVVALPPRGRKNIRGRVDHRRRNTTQEECPDNPRTRSEIATGGSTCRLRPWSPHPFGCPLPAYDADALRTVGFEGLDALVGITSMYPLPSGDAISQTARTCRSATGVGETRAASMVPDTTSVSQSIVITVTSNRYSRPNPKYADIPTKASTASAEATSRTQRVARSIFDAPSASPRKAKDTAIARKPRFSSVMNTPCGLYWDRPRHPASSPQERRLDRLQLHEVVDSDDRERDPWRTTRRACRTACARLGRVRDARGEHNEAEHHQQRRIHPQEVARHELGGLRVRVGDRGAGAANGPVRGGVVTATPNETAAKSAVATEDPSPQRARDSLRNAACDAPLEDVRLQRHDSRWCLSEDQIRSSWRLPIQVTAARGASSLRSRERPTPTSCVSVDRNGFEDELAVDLHAVRDGVRAQPRRPLERRELDVHRELAPCPTA